jgi:molybdopterin synthase sulfur carrier subunit
MRSDPVTGDDMIITIRFFSRFGELLGGNLRVETKTGVSLGDLIRQVAGKNKDGYAAIFDENGSFHDFIIVMHNRKRVRTTDTEAILPADGDEIAVFPPVAGG